MDYNLREEEPWDLIVMSETVLLSRLALFLL